MLVLLELGLGVRHDEAIVTGDAGSRSRTERRTTQEEATSGFEPLYEALQASA